MTILKSTAFSTLLVTLGGALISFINFATMIFLMRYFAPAEFGGLSILLSIIAVLLVFMDFGTTPSVLRFGPMLEESGLLNKRSQVLRSVLSIRFYAGSALFLTGIVFSRPISQLLLHDPSQWMLIAIALTAAIATSFSQYIATLFQAEEKFLEMISIRILESAIKIAAIVGLIRLGLAVEPILIVVVYAIAPVLAIGMMIPFVKRSTLLVSKEQGVTQKVISLSFWYMVSSVNIMIFMNFDLFIVAAIRSTEEVGYYNSGYRIASLLYLIVNALFAILMPRISRKITDADLMKFIRKSFYACLGLAIGMIPIIFIGKYIFDVLRLDLYREAIPIYYLTAADHITMVLFAPVLLLLFAINRPKLMAVISGVEMILNIIGDLLTVPIYGAVGAASTTLLIRLVVSILTAWILIRDYKNRRFLMRDIF